MAVHTGSFATPRQRLQSFDGIATARLAIGPSSAADALVLATIAADPQVAQSYCVGSPGKLPHLEFEQCSATSLPAGVLNLAVRGPNTEVIGFVQFARGNLSYFLAPAEWGKGYGLEMVGAACEHYAARLALPLVRAEVIRENTASRRILDKLGFRFAGLALRPWANRHGHATMLRYELTSTGNNKGPEHDVSALESDLPSSPLQRPPIP